MRDEIVINGKKVRILSQTGNYRMCLLVDENRDENEHLAKIVNLIDEKRGAVEGLLSCQSANDVLAYIETHSKNEVE